MRSMLRVLPLMLLISVIRARAGGVAWRQTGFVIGGYRPGGDPISLVRLNDAGVGLVVTSDSPSPPKAREIAGRLDSLRMNRPTFRMQALIYQETDRANTLFKNPDPVANRAAILDELAGPDGLDNPAVAGWYIWDEPPIYYPPGRKPSSDRVFASIHEMTSLLRDSTREAGTIGKLALTNLLSIQNVDWFRPPCSPGTLTAYACYLEQYLARFDSDVLPAPVICFDKYPFEWPGADFRLSFAQLAVIRDKAIQHSRADYRIPFWSVIQASPRQDNGRSPYRPTPTFNQIRWQAYVAITYGARGILYWTLRPTHAPPAIPGYGASFLRRDGSTNGALYDSLAALNAELRALGPTLMTLEPVAVFHAAANRFVLPARDDSLARAGSPSQLVARLASRTPEGMAGSFRGAAPTERYVMVANKDTVIAQSFRVTLRQSAGTVERISKHDGRRIPVAIASPTTFDTGIIAPGGGELFRIVPPLAVRHLTGRSSESCRTRSPRPSGSRRR